MPKRRYQEGRFEKDEKRGRYFCFFYRDRSQPDGSTKSVYTRIDLGKIGEISEQSARREHNRLRQLINRERGSVPTAPKGETFEAVAETYMKDIGPQLSIATVRQRISHLKSHLLPRLGPMPLMGIDVRTLQRFINDLSVSSSRKSILNILGTMNSIFAHAKKCDIRVPEFPAKSLVIAGDRDGAEAVYFKRADIQRIIEASKEPYRTIFILASVSGLRAGELFGLTVDDIDFERMLIRPRKQADDRTRVLRERPCEVLEIDFSGYLSGVGQTLFRRAQIIPINSLVVRYRLDALHCGPLSTIRIGSFEAARDFQEPSSVLNVSG